MNPRTRFRTALLLPLLLVAALAVTTFSPAPAYATTYCDVNCLTDAGFAFLTDDKTGQCLAIGNGSTTNGAPAIQWPCEHILNQDWHLFNDSAYPYGYGSNVYEVVNASTGQCLAVPHASTTQCTGIIQWPCNDGPEQRWSQVDTSVCMDTTCALFINYHSGQCLAIPGGSTTQGRQAIQWPCDNNDDQSWRMS